jgi:hypothetical protein
MKSIKVSEAIPTQLDWLVAKLEGMSVTQALALCEKRGSISLLGGMIFSPSTDWSQGGPIIEREKISVVEGMDGEWQAGMRPYKFRYGPTPLIAAMRCYVTSKMGAEVEIPEELT